MLSDWQHKSGYSIVNTMLVFIRPTTYVSAYVHLKAGIGVGTKQHEESQQPQTLFISISLARSIWYLSHRAVALQADRFVVDSAEMC